MAGTTNSLAAALRGKSETYTTSSSADEVDLLTGIPFWVKWVSIYPETSAMVMQMASALDPASDSLTLAGDCSPVPADGWSGAPYTGGDIAVASAGTSVRYHVALYEKRP